jgi:hypothetical protein
MVTVVDEATALVLTANVAFLAPAATITLEGAPATVVLLLDRVTCAPPAGAGPLSVTVPVEDCPPPTTLIGLRLSDERVAGGGDAGVTRSEAELVAWPQAAEMVTVVDAATTLVLTMNDALVAPAAIVTLEGTLAAVVLLLESATCAPPAGAGSLNFTVPVEEFPLVTLVGFSTSEERETDTGTEESSNSKIAGLGSFCETATNFVEEII